MLTMVRAVCEAAVGGTDSAVTLQPNRPSVTKLVAINRRFCSGVADLGATDFHDMRRAQVVVATGSM